MNDPTKTPLKKPLCFVIGPIGKEGAPERKHSDLLLNALIKHVLKAEEFDYIVRRADEDADPGMIGDRVISDIIHAELVIADLTDLNPNAFYELGIRHSTELPTIHVARIGTVLPFDNVSHRTIFIDLADWHSIEQARNRLADSVRTIRAPDYRVSNPITQANASFKMRESTDPRERLIAELQDRLTSIESRLPSGENAAPRKDGSEKRLDDVQFNTVIAIAAEARRLWKEKHSPNEIVDAAQRVASSHGFTISAPYLDGDVLRFVDRSELGVSGIQLDWPKPKRKPDR